MANLGRTLRLQILGVRTKEPRCYYLSLQVLGPGASAAALLPYTVVFNPADDQTAQASAEALRPDEVCRTETSGLNRYPEFANSAFILRLPCSLLACITAGSGARVAVSLFAAPSLDGPAGPIVAGREVDQLVASAVLELAPAVVSRLLAGDSANVPLQLQEAASPRQQQQLLGGLGGQAAQLQGLRKSTAASHGTDLHNGSYGSCDHQVLLQLSLVDAALPLPSNSFGQQPGLTQQQQQQQQQLGPGSLLHTRVGASARESMPAGSSRQVVLSVMVSAAANLPMVPGPDGQLAAPRAFVALKSGADSVARRPAQAGQLLHVAYPDSELSREQLLIAVVNEGTSRVLVKGSLPLSGLIPGCHYCLAVALSDACVLHVTLVLGLGAKTQMEVLQGSGIAAAGMADQMRLLQLRLASCSHPLGSLLQQQGKLAQGAEVWAVWRAQPASSKTSNSQQPLQLYTSVDGREGGESAASSAIRGINGSCGLLSHAVLGAAADQGSCSAAASAPAAEAVVAALPLQTLGQLLEERVSAAASAAGEEGSGVTTQLWPPDHQVLLPFWPANPVAATLELHLQTYPAGTPGSGSSSRQAMPPLTTCLGSLELPSSLVTGQRSGRTFLLRDQLLKPPTSSSSSSVLAAGGVRCMLEGMMWDLLSYLDHLRLSGGATDAAAGGAGQLQGAAAVGASRAFPDAPSQDALQQQGMLSGLVSGSGPLQLRSLGNVLESLVGDCLMKQQLLERLTRVLDVAESRAEVAACRLADLHNSNCRLAGDLQHLRQLLHEEKEAGAAALGSCGSNGSSATLPGSTTSITAASRQELQGALCVALAGQARERSRNGELVNRLQQLHSDRVDVVALQKQYAELQAAHLEQSKLLVAQEGAATSTAALKRALTDQEAVIGRLESLLAAAAARTKEGEGWRSTSEALQQEVARLRQELSRLAAVHPADEMASLASQAAQAQAAQQAAAAALAEGEQAAAAAAAAAAAQCEAALVSKESGRLAAAMRAERAEASAVAAQNELLDVTKRYAREIALLKTKLAEKDAQLLGGFGSLASLYLGELGPPGGLSDISSPADALLDGAGLGLGVGPAGGLVGMSSLFGVGGQGGSQGLGRGSAVPWELEAVQGHQGCNSSSRVMPAVPAGQALQQQVLRAGSPKLEPLATTGLNGSSPRQQQQQQQERLRSAEERRKPGSLLAPLLQQPQQQPQRLTSSAEGLRRGSSTNPRSYEGGSGAGAGIDGGAMPPAASGLSMEQPSLQQQAVGMSSAMASPSVAAAFTGAGVGGLSARSAAGGSWQKQGLEADDPAQSLRQHQQQQPDVWQAASGEPGFAGGPTGSRPPSNSRQQQQPGMLQQQQPGMLQQQQQQGMPPQQSQRAAAPLAAAGRPQPEATSPPPPAKRGFRFW